MFGHLELLKLTLESLPASLILWDLETYTTVKSSERSGNKRYLAASRQLVFKVN